MTADDFDFARKRVYVAGHRGMVGSAIVRKLVAEGCEVLYANRADLDLVDQARVIDWFQLNRPDAVFLAAAKVGGIHANNKYRAEFIYENLAIATNIIHAAYLANVKKLMFLGSSCIYPKLTQQPISEHALLTGPLETTNEPYAIAKIAGLKMTEAYRCQYGCNYISVMPTNLYGTGDNYHPENSHVAAALIRRMAEAARSKAAEVVVWGSGTPRREFLHVDDLADACVHLMRVYSGSDPINVGTGQDITIADLAKLIADIAGFQGRITFDRTRPDGTPRKLLDVSRLASLGWKAKISLEQGLRQTYADYLANPAREI